MIATIRPIRPADDTPLADIIHAVLGEFGATGDGFAGADAEMASLSAAYAAPRHAYFVAEAAGQVIGGAGIAPLDGGDATTAELRKMYLLPTSRGHGVGARLMRACLDAARAAGFTRVYLETLESMTAARRLYQAHGFVPLDAPLGDTGHHGCNCWYALTLD